MVTLLAHRLCPASPPACTASMFMCDTGGELNKVTHFYAYESMAQREALRLAAARSQEWVAYVDAGRKFMSKQVGPKHTPVGGFPWPTHTGKHTCMRCAQMAAQML